MTFEQLILILMPVGGLSLIAALVWWQNERDLRPNKNKK